VGTHEDSIQVPGGLPGGHFGLLKPMRFRFTRPSTGTCSFEAIRQARPTSRVFSS
jgi:hypothetical protein